MKRFLITVAMLVMVLAAPVTRVEAASAKKPVVSSVTKKPKKTTIKFKKYSKNTIYYTTNGKTPKKGESYTKKYSSKGVSITSTKTVKAISYVRKKKSAVFSKKYGVYPKPSISKTKLTMTVGSTKTIKVKNAKTSVKWSSSKTKVATVSSKGKIKAKKTGTATITAKVNGGKVTCKVTVKKKGTSGSKVDDDEVVNEKLPIVHVATLTMDGRTIKLGDSLSKLIGLWGQPSRIDATAEINVATGERITRYVYNDDQSRIILFDVIENRVTGWYTASPHATVDGFTPGSSVCTENIFNTAMKKLYKPQDGEWTTMHSVYSYEFFDVASESNNYFYTDSYGTSNLLNKVIGIYSCLGQTYLGRNPMGEYLLADNERSMTMAIESMDVVNGYRYLHGRYAYVWDTKGYAEREARAHNTDMAVNNFFGHETTRFDSNGLRNFAAYCTVHDSHPSSYYGIGCDYIVSNSGENVCLSASTDSIYHMVVSLYNHQGHREQILSRVYKEYGAGYGTNSRGTKTYLTQEFVTYEQ